MNRLRRVSIDWVLTDVNAQNERIVPVIFLGPTNDEFFRVMIEIFLVKWRWVHRIEELLDSIDEHFDSMVLSLMQFEFKTSRRAPGRKPDELFANPIDLSDSFFRRRSVFVLDEHANSPYSFQHLCNHRKGLDFAAHPEKLFFQVIEQNRLPNEFGALGGITLEHERTERFGAAQPSAKAHELREMFTL